MTFIPLSDKNFVLNKTTNSVEIKYKDSDQATHLCSESINSKSLVNLNAYDRLTPKEVNLEETDPELVSKTNEIKAFFSVIAGFDADASDPAEHPTAKNYFDTKSSHINTTLSNENIKEYNFRNYSKIEKIDQKFLPDSFELQKKNIVKNNLYRNYYSNYSLDYYKNMKKGFCNYNSINFFSQKINSDTNHTNCIVWPNPKEDTTKNLYDLYNNNFNITFYVNLRKNYSDEKQPECLMHVPDLFSLYIVKGVTENTHRICIVSGQNSKRNLYELNRFIFRSASKNIDNDLMTYITSDLNILNNSWYNISINFIKNADNYRDLNLYIDGLEVDTVSLDFTQEKAENFNSYLCLGNKPEYEAAEENVYKTNYDKIYYSFFGIKFDSTENPVSGPFINKDISFGKSTGWLDTGQFNIEDIEDDEDIVTFRAVTDGLLKSESFHGEIHDIRIYLKSLTEEKILFNCSNSVQSIEDEKINENLVFYIPAFYMPLYVKRQSHVNNSNGVLNLYYSGLYNPYYSNFCGGLEVSSESYLLDFVNFTKPNIVIGGNNTKNIYGDKSNESNDYLIDYNDSDDISMIKKGFLSTKIYNKNLNKYLNGEINLNGPNGPLNTLINQAVSENNLTYRNLLILPNDNGLIKVNFNIINEVKNSLEDFDNDSNTIDETLSHHISIDNVFSSSLYKKVDLSKKESDIRDDPISFQISTDKGLQKFNFHLNKIFNVSNILYHDDRIDDTENILSSFDVESDDYDILSDRLSTINSIFPMSTSNPITRNYKQNVENFKFSEFILQEDYTIDEISYRVNYFKLPVYYSDLNFDYDCIFNSIFDIKNTMYNKSINKKSFKLKDSGITTTNNNISMEIVDDGFGCLYRNDCLTKVADWNYIGHIFYKEGIVSINRPEMTYFGENDFECSFTSDYSMFIKEVNIPAEYGKFNVSQNVTYDENLRHDESAFNSESRFVYITDIHLHDENLNVVAKAKLARPAPKKDEDSILFRLKMDF